MSNSDEFTGFAEAAQEAYDSLPRLLREGELARERAAFESDVRELRDADQKMQRARNEAQNALNKAFLEAYEYGEDYLMEALRIAVKDVQNKARTSW